jgi:hypothetical protein
MNWTGQIQQDSLFFSLIAGNSAAGDWFAADCFLRQLINVSRCDAAPAPRTRADDGKPAEAVLGGRRWG